MAVPAVTPEFFVPLTSTEDIYYLGLPINFIEFKSNVIDLHFDNPSKHQIARDKAIKLNVMLRDNVTGEYTRMVLDFWKKGREENLYLLGCRGDSYQYHHMFAHPSKLSLGNWACISWNRDEKCLYIRILHEHFYFKEPNVAGQPVNLQSLLDGTYYSSDHNLRTAQRSRKSWLVSDIEDREYSNLAAWDVVKYLGTADSVDGLYVRLDTYLDKVPQNLRTEFRNEIGSEKGFPVLIQDFDEKGAEGPYKEARVIRIASEADYLVIKFHREFDLIMGWTDGSVVGLKWVSYNKLSYSLVSHAKHWLAGVQ